MKNELDTTGKVKSLNKALSLLDFFTIDEPIQSVSSLVNKTGLPKSTISNILTTFCVNGFLEKQANGKYGIGKKVLALTHIYKTQVGNQSWIKNILNNLSHLCDETIYYAVPYDENIIYLDAISSKDYIINSIHGVVAPMHCTGLGKAILAFLRDDEIKIIASKPMKKYTESTITDESKLLEELKHIKTCGYSIDNMEHEYGIKCVAVPILKSGIAIGAISISGPSLRFDDETIKKYANLIANEINNI